MADREKERLDELGHEIDEARSQAQAHDTIRNPEHTQGLYEAGEGDDATGGDDHTVTPPG